MKTLKIQTQNPKEIIDITEKIEENLPPDNSGILVIHILHTTAALTTADLDPGTDKDMLDAFSQMTPDLDYRHPHDPSHVGDHILSSVIGNSVTIPYKRGKILLGTWQRIIVVEFNGPRERKVTLSLMKSSNDNT